jgi:hypothetical protein
LSQGGNFWGKEFGKCSPNNISVGLCILALLWALNVFKCLEKNHQEKNCFPNLVDQGTPSQRYILWDVFPYLGKCCLNCNPLNSGTSFTLLNVAFPINHQPLLL